MKYKPILSKEPVTYKEQKKDNELMAKYRVILKVKKDGNTHFSVSESFSMSRNTVGNIICDFETKLDVNTQKEVLDPKCILKVLNNFKFKSE